MSMLNLFKQKTEQTTQLPELGGIAARHPIAPDIVNLYEDVENIEITDDQELLVAMEEQGDDCPVFLTVEQDFLAISQNELAKDEALIVRKIRHLAEKVWEKDIEPKYATRAVIASLITRQEQSLQARMREGSEQVEQMLKTAIEQKATDIHLEIRNKRAVVTLRVYGQRSISETFDNKQGEKIISAIWNIYVEQPYSRQDVAKDGRFTYKYQGQEWLCRVSYVHSKVNQTRSVAIRLRDMHHIPALNELGYHNSQLADFKKASINKGMTLIIGAVNSGKSTTQTAIMKSRPPLDKNYEISDQIEVELANFVQIQLPIEGSEEWLEENRERVRRTTTRHDVDFIAINEIRDLETAAMAASMMLQGTAGIASIHGSAWVDAINRLLSDTDLNVSKDILFSESFLSLIVVQSLVGLLCHHCKISRHPDPDLDAYYREGFGPQISPNLRFINKTGCSDCRHTGIEGLTLIAEVMPVNGSNRHLFTRTDKPQAVRDWMAANQVLNIHQHAHTKIATGIVDPAMVQQKIGPYTPDNLFDLWHTKPPQQQGQAAGKVIALDNV